MPPHRKKLKRFDEPGHAHFLTFSCWHRLPLLSKDRTCLWFLEALNRARVRHGFELWAWVLMPDHVHLLIRPTRPACRIGSVLNAVKKRTGELAIGYLRKHAPGFLERLASRGPSGEWYRFWQAGGGWDENVTDPRRVHEVIEYIHLNPVQQGLVLRPTDWRWSSARAWLLGVDEPIAIDRTVPSHLIFPAEG